MFATPVGQCAFGGQGKWFGLASYARAANITHWPGRLPQQISTSHQDQCLNGTRSGGPLPFQLPGVSP